MEPRTPPGDVAWRPDPAAFGSANAVAFMRALGVPDWDALVAFADREPERFYRGLLDAVGFRFFQPFGRALDESAGIAWPRWCTGGTTNVVLNALDRWRGTPTYDKTALEWEGEDGARRTLTYRALDAEVCRFAAGLRSLGLGRGDVVALYLPNLVEAMVASLAIPKIGAIAMPLFSGFGADAMAQRLELGGAKALVTVDASLRRGRLVGAKAVVDAALAGDTRVEHVIVLRHAGNPVDWNPSRDHWWHELVAGRPDDAPTEPMEADAPFLLMFTSGTTGRPKGVVHTHVGFPMKLVLDLWLTMDFRADDRLLWISDMGWVVGPMLAYGTPVMGATLVQVEGAPNFPQPDRMWRVLARQGVTYLGVAPTTIRTFMAEGCEPWRSHDLSCLRVVVSSGEPWTPQAWQWLFERVCGARVPLLNFSGGTEMIGIVGCTPLKALKPCAFNTAIPGTGADVVDDEGRSLPPGRVGELVMRRPPIGLTRGLWRDDGRYLDTYWSTWPGLWHHGDFASRDADGHWLIHGRSDDTLKIAGKRTGPAEIESLLMGTGELAEAAAVGVPDPIKGQALVLVCSTRPGVQASDALRDELAAVVARGLGAPFRPRAVMLVADLPKTRNLKIMRRVIRAAVLGQDPGDLSALVNPEAVEALRAERGALG